jgi:hypothetical protein
MPPALSFPVGGGTCLIAAGAEPTRLGPLLLRRGPPGQMLTPVMAPSKMTFPSTMP